MIATPAFTRDYILEHARSLPAAPQVLAGLSELLQDVNTDLSQIADQIRMDPALAARVIRVGNSVAFGAPGSIGSVDEAVNRVGFGEVLRLVGVATVAGMVDRSLVCYGIEAERLRETFLLHALAAETLAPLTGIEPQTAYSAGLLRGIGIMILDRAARGKLRPAEHYRYEDFPNYAQWELARFGLLATEVAGMILDEWHFPTDVIEAVQHHQLLDGVGRANPFACTLNLAGAIAMAEGLALPGEVLCWKSAPEVLAVVGLDEAAFEHAHAAAVERFAAQRMALF